MHVLSHALTTEIMYELMQRSPDAPSTGASSTDAPSDDVPSGDVVGIRLTGKLTAEDYDRLAPYLEEKASAHGPLRVLVLMEDWEGWDSLTAMWEDLKLDATLNDHVERLAMVGEEDWERWMTEITKPLAEGKLRYFDRSALGAAWAWVEEGTTQRA